MCAIQAVIYQKLSKLNAEFVDNIKKISEANTRRGPDIQGAHLVEVEANNGKTYLIQFKGFVLSLRGEKTTQPIICENSGNIFLWNGEVFDGVEMNFEQNDGKTLFLGLEEKSENEKDVLEFFQKIRGPYSFMYYQTLPYHEIQVETNEITATENQNILSLNDFVASNETKMLIEELEAKLYASLKVRIESSINSGITGLAGVKELRKRYPTRIWNWVEVNVLYEEVLQHRQHIIDLLGPNYTVMDLSIGMALWFAARGEGTMYSSEKSLGEHNYRSPAKILILGSGADEQFGGYSRHRKGYEAGGITQLSKEIKFDVERISKRNLGRDDRIISDHGREARFPYLDESVVDFLSSIATSSKMNLSLPRGIGDKLLLRLVAFNMGLKVTSMQAKRAIQFGARTAKMESGKDKGDDVLL
ncbi:hypothetical protein BB561_003201 [Smittium simulii]|uniref:Asparagine synthetase domain-containing protein n=1 Tax=Smittium simulii TaxID=133385 RepID=A0A2T9YML0_9FUNG|nr:hypothetical protein BB561_003201 [Smittium simulii]